MELKEVQKSSTEALRSSTDDLKIKQRKCSQNPLGTVENHSFFEIRRPVGSSDLHWKGSWDQMLRLWRCHFEALELPEAPKGDQESPKKLSKRPQVTIHWPCRWIMSSQGAAAHPLQAPKELLGSQNKVQGSPEEPHRSFEELKGRS